MPPERRAPRNAGGSARDPGREEVPRQEPEGNAPAQAPDVLLDVPALNVEELELEVDNLKARVAVQAELADMVKLHVGVDVDLGKVKLGIKGVEAQAILKVRLDNIREIFEQALRAIDRDPSILEKPAGGEAGGADGRPADRTAAENARGAPEEAGRTVRRTVDETGSVLETVLGGSGEVVEETASGSLADLPVEEEYLDDEGRIVGRARDDAGNVVEEELDEEGNVVGMLGFVGAEEAERPKVEATAPAERRARELGVDLTTVEGTGSGGRVLVRDVERAARSGG